MCVFFFIGPNVPFKKDARGLAKNAKNRRQNVLTSITSFKKDVRGHANRWEYDRDADIYIIYHRDTEEWENVLLQQQQQEQQKENKQTPKDRQESGKGEERQEELEKDQYEEMESPLNSPSYYEDG